MHFPFTHELKVEGIWVAEYTGNAVIERDPAVPSEWRITGIELDGFDDRKRVQVSVSPSSALYREIALGLLKRDRHDIDEAWELACREAKVFREEYV